MTSEITTNQLYAEKENAYYGLVRSDIIDLIPKGATTLLDVGCGAGNTRFAAKKQLGVQEVVGIEYYEPAAQIAQTKLDKVIVGDIEQIHLGLPDKHFDCILCADVLEHTKDPWQVLRTLRGFLRDDGVLIASIPNLRHIVPMLKILFNRFEYEPSGILDKTHLRFFTLHTIRGLFEETNFSIQHMSTNRSKNWKSRLLNFVSLGLMRQFLIYQYIIVARKKSAGSV